jgi:hypothetical protein
MSETRDSMSAATADYSRLLYRSQFILGPRLVDTFASWQRLTIRGSWHLTVHPDLNVCCVQHNAKTLLLLGFILDPEHPQASDREILTALMPNFVRSPELFMQTARFGGRWILIVDDGSTVVLFHDAAGLRQVFYTDVGSTQQLWCASQPTTLAEILGLQVDGDAQDFISSPDIRRNPEYWWPGDSSLYKEVKHLLPNHCLNLESGRCDRYWPSRKLPHLSLDRVVEDCSSILRGLLASAVNRFDLVVALTAGLDSRLVLAACHGIQDQVSYMTVKQLNNSLNNDTDIMIASSLLRRLRLQHDLVLPAPKGDELFLRIFDHNVMPAHEIWSHDALALFDFYQLSKVTVTGGVSEVARFYYRLPPHIKQGLSGERLAVLAGMGNHPFAVDHFNKWLNGIGEPYNVDVLDLFYWEQRAGNWLAMCQLEYDIARKDTFTPYNCRQLLMNMLSADDIYRRPPQYALYKKMIQTLWPEVLAEPINPHRVRTRTQRLKRRMKSHLATLKHSLSNQFGRLYRGS